MSTTYAVTVSLETDGIIDDTIVDRLLGALTPYSGSLAHTEGVMPARIDVVVDIEAQDPAAAADAGLHAVRDVLAAAGLPADGQAIGIRVVRAVDQDLAADSPGIPQLLGLTEVGQLLGVSRQRVTQLRARADFPEPLTMLASGPVWAAPALTHFMAGWDRTPGGRRRSPTAAVA